ncbi:hypothetical protein D6853_06550 [Butyrivibrio sp. X503]|uniref:acyltransferase family protein n=1 Tax=Butyrivibrio sp. X503 TaxID=2364878 RepID=UPI000EA96957|nr:acyltransferase [Butyrivibrio sp. X503]RKM56442.1 hypothetical protein D6853_06550 [Butyrivibrio sp. X503]
MYPIFIIYIILPVIFLWRSRIAKEGEWNNGFLSLEQSKALQGICVIIIVIHHISQKVFADQEISALVRSGMSPFANMGAFLTSVFFFFNGYGLYKSYINKPGYLDHFLKKRLIAPLVAYYVTGWAFLVIRLALGEEMGRKLFVLYLTEIVHCSPYSWYIVILMIFYVVFYLVFKYAKNERSAITLFTIIVLAYIAIALFVPKNDYFIRGEWWYNSIIMMPLGMWLARREDKIIDHVKRNYNKYLVIHLIPAFPAFRLSYLILKKIGYFSDSIPNGIICKLISLSAQTLAIYVFIACILLISMNISIGNKVLAFLGKYTLEIYLIHGIFVELYDHDFVGIAPSPFPIEKVSLYALAVIASTIPLALLLKKLEKVVTGK